MTATVLGHTGRPPGPHDVLASWEPDPVVLLGLAAAGAALAWGATRRSPPARARLPLAVAGLVALAVALVSPLDAVADALASAHMVQHVLLTLVAAPLLALGRPFATVLRAAPLSLRRRAGGATRALGLTAASRAIRRPVVAWMLHAGSLWLWHSSTLYDAAVRSSFVHALEHATFLGTALLFWGVVLGTASRRPLSDGTGMLLVFTMALQSVLLAALLTFAESPWYEVYEGTTDAWGLDPLADQQLAGAIMWVPAGFIYVGVALALLARWIRQSERDAPPGLVPRPDLPARQKA